jgi:hypothetical protein
VVVADAEAHAQHALVPLRCSIPRQRA